MTNSPVVCVALFGFLSKAKTATPKHNQIIMNAFPKLALLVLMMACLTASQAQHVFSLTGGKVVMKNNSQLVLKNTSYINGGGGLQSDSAMVRFTGSNTDSIGGAATTFPRLVMDKSGGNVLAKKDVSISDSLMLNSGLIKLGEQHLILMPGAGSEAGSAGSYVQTDGLGAFERSVQQQRVVFPIGGSSYRPVTLSNSGTSDVFDARVTDAVLRQGTSGSAFSSEVVASTWVLEEQTAGGSNLNMQLGWNASDELAPFNRSSAFISTYTQNWDIQPAAPASGSNPFFLSRANLDSVGIFAIFNEDTTPPQITCPANIVQANDLGTCGAVVTYTAPVGTDNLFEPATILTAGLASGATFSVGTTTVEYTATDAFGLKDSCTFDVTVYDGEKPVASCPQDIVVANDSAVCGASVSYSITSSDNCAGSSLSQAVGQASGTIFPIGTTTNIFILTDASYNTDTCSFSVTVSDTENPAISCPPNIAVSNDLAVCGAVVSYQITSSDNCSVSHIQNDSSGLTSDDFFPIGTTTQRYLATDASGNTTSCSFTITVSDTSNPDILCPANIAVSNDSGLCGAIASYQIISSDNCSATHAQSDASGLTSGDFFPVGTTTQSYLATDASGNTASCSFTITVNDTTDPEVTCPTNIAMSNDSGLCGAIVSYQISSSDNCSATHAQSDASGLTSGDFFPIGTTTQSYLATDASGNTASCSFTITVNDTTDPVIVCPANIAVSNGSGVCGAIVSYQISSSDNCSATHAQSDASGLTSGDFFPVGTTTQSYLATDASGNTASCSFTVTVSDTSNPVIVCPANIAVSNDSGICGAIVSYQISSSDNCSASHAQRDSSGLTSGGFFPIGTTTQRYLATDASGNITSCSFTITVSDTSNPVIVCPANIAVSNDSGVCGAIVSYQINSSDNCSATHAQSNASGLTSGDFFPIGTTTQSYLATDASGNTASCSFTITVSDTSNPVIVCPSNIVVSNDSGLCGASVPYQISSSDNCSASHAQNDSSGLTSGNFFPVGITLQRWTAVDASGNSTSCSFTIVVDDEEKPSISIGSTSITHCQFSPFVDPGYSAWDNCGGDMSSQVLVSGTVNYNVPGTYYLHYDVSDAAGNAALRQTRQVIVLSSPQLSVLSASVCPGTQLNIAALVRDYSMQAMSFEFYANGTLIGQTPTRLGQARYPAYQMINSDTSFTVIGTGANGCTFSAQIIVTTRSCSSILATKAMLEGAYDSTAGRMHDGLRSNNLIPIIEPYTAMGQQFVGGGGEAMQSGVLATSGSNAIVDWVVIELRDSANPQTISHSRAALIQADGDVVDMDGVSNLQLDSTLAGSYYLAVWHRNHLGVMTAQPIMFNGSTVSVDFSDPNLLTYGSTATRRTVNGTALLFGGDADHNGQIQNTDNVLEWIPSAGTAGYKSADFNLDGQVQNSDMIYFWLRNAGRGSAVPR